MNLNIDLTEHRVFRNIPKYTKNTKKFPWEKQGRKSYIKTREEKDEENRHVYIIDNTSGIVNLQYFRIEDTTSSTVFTRRSMNETWEYYLTSSRVNGIRFSSNITFNRPTYDIQPNDNHFITVKLNENKNHFWLFNKRSIHEILQETKYYRFRAKKPDQDYLVSPLPWNVEKSNHNFHEGMNPIVNFSFEYSYLDEHIILGRSWIRKPKIPWKNYEKGKKNPLNTWGLPSEFYDQFDDVNDVELEEHVRADGSVWWTTTQDTINFLNRNR